MGVKNEKSTKLTENDKKVINSCISQGIYCGSETAAKENKGRNGMEPKNRIAFVPSSLIDPYHK